LHQKNLLPKINLSFYLKNKLINLFKNKSHYLFTLTNQPITKPKIVCHKLKSIPYERKISTNLFTYYKNLSYSKKPIRFFLSAPLFGALNAE
ncbi:hypothetical protein, partial [Bacteroides heparinolyticus]|uniref:hypothetical protein n=2 Tax=Prevotella heparinolytica TaxID=28113 RepID=UPI00359FCE34